MASLDWSQCPAVESIPGKVSGAWVFRGTRVPVAAIFENLKTSPIEEVLENFHVTREQVQTVLDFAAKSTQPRCPRDELTNGDLLSAAEEAGFDVLLTADKNMSYQQNLSGLRIALGFLETHLGGFSG
jgi:uncharacterized protein (DUF433 family)